MGAPDLQMIGLALLAMGTVLIAFTWIAYKNRKLVLNEVGVQAFDWRGKLKLDVEWDYVDGFFPSVNDVVTGDTSYRLYTYKGNVDLDHFADLSGIEACVKIQMAKKWDRLREKAKADLDSSRQSLDE